MSSRNSLISLIWCVSGVVITSSAKEPASLYSYFERFFDQIESREVKPASIGNAEIAALMKRANPHELLSFLEPYISSQDVRVRSQALGLQVKVAELHPSRQVRQEIVQSLVGGLTSEGQTDRRFHRKYAQFLLNFTQDDFSEHAKAAIVEALQAREPSWRLVLVSGVAQIKETLRRLEEFLFDEVAYANDPNMRLAPEWYFTLGWHARLARARMGVQADVEKCLVLLDTLDDVRVFTMSLSDLAYMRQPEAIECLKRYFLSDLRLAPANPGGMGEPVSNYLMPIMADCLSNFPVKRRDARNYSQQERERCRRWVTEQKEWKIRR